MRGWGDDRLRGENNHVACHKILITRLPTSWVAARLIPGWYLGWYLGFCVGSVSLKNLIHVLGPNRNVGYFFQLVVVSGGLNQSFYLCDYIYKIVFSAVNTSSLQMTRSLTLFTLVLLLTVLHNGKLFNARILLITVGQFTPTTQWCVSL